MDIVKLLRNGSLYEWHGKESRRPNQAADEIERMRKKCKNMALLLNDCREHLEYCGYGDRWERQRAEAIGLSNRLESALREKE